MKSFYVYCLFISKRLHDGVLQRPNKLFTFAAFFLKVTMTTAEERYEETWNIQNALLSNNSPFVSMISFALTSVSSSKVILCSYSSQNLTTELVVCKSLMTSRLMMLPSCSITTAAPQAR